MQTKNSPLGYQMAEQWETKLLVNEVSILTWQLDNKETSRRVLAGASLDEARKAVSDERLASSKEQRERIAATPEMDGKLGILRDIVVDLHNQISAENELEASERDEWTAEKIAEHERVEEEELCRRLEAQGLSTTEAARAVAESRDRVHRSDADEVERRAGELVANGQSEEEAATAAADEMFHRKQVRHKHASRSAALAARGVDGHRHYEIVNPSITPKDAAIVRTERAAKYYQQRCTELENRVRELETDALSKRLNNMQAYLNSVQSNIDRLRPAVADAAEQTKTETDEATPAQDM